ncbi:antitoxin Xre/MbcA/ParS toxin-binding domain-containing protein (plasmid) [Microbulbifer sp. ANSA003]|uniref:MbcA/ParS/Xre antitoxin family protein n=1 Tax=Microbulbifer sp. ANSA003 TaxID=3243360 RepID=UPI004043031C
MQVDKAKAAGANLNRVAVKLFFAIAEEWSLTEAQQCTVAGLSSRTTLRNWRLKLEGGEEIKLSKDTLERLSYISGIYKSLQILFSTPDQWRGWIRKPNRDFGGNSALDHMLAGRVVDLADVRRYLDGWRGDQYV